MVGPILGVYLAFKIGDMFIRETFKYLFIFDTAALMFIAEMLLMIIAFFMFLSKKVTHSVLGLFIASSLVIGGVILNRIDNFVVAYKSFYNPGSYFPSFGEISVTLGCIALLVLIYRAIVMIFPVISQDRDELVKKMIEFGKFKSGRVK